MEIWPGQPFPLGATYDGSGTNFAVFSEAAERIELCLFDDGVERRVTLPEVTAFVHHGYVPGIGAALTFKTLRSYWAGATLSAAIKVFAAPLIGLLLARWLALSSAEMRMALIFLACPSATVTYIMAQQMGADDGLAANIVVLSTLLALPSLAVVLTLT